MTVSDLVFRSAPDAMALRAEGRRPLTYGAFRERIDATAAYLNGHGVDADSVVALVLPNGPEAASAFLGIAAAGTVAPLNPHFTDAELDFYLRDLRAQAVVTIREFEAVTRAAARLGIAVFLLETAPEQPAGWFGLSDGGAPRSSRAGRAPRRPLPADHALMLHTSGTTARPKLVGLTHANLCASAGNIAASLALSPSDCCLNVMPLFHIHGLGAALLASLHAGAQVYCSPGFNAHRFFGWLIDSQATWYTAVPTMHQAILARANVNRPALAAHRLRFVRSCSSALPLQAWDALERVFHVPLVSAYGMTEASHQISCTTVEARTSKRGSVGTATGVDIAIMDQAGGLVPTGQKGEVVLRGQSVIAAYVGDCEANATAFSSGWFRTGDQGVLDQDGVLTLTGRLKEMINTGGEKVSPLEVDQVLMDHPGVSQAVAFGVADSLLGERVGAAVVLRPGHEPTVEAIRSFAAQRLVKHKVPRPLVIVAAIPTGPTGKFQRTLLAGQLGLV